MATGRKKNVGANPGKNIAPDLKQLARDLLSENGEQPDHWIIVERHESDKYRLFCGLPPFALAEESQGSLLDLAYQRNVSLALLLTIERGEIETLVCASLGFLGNLLCDGSFDPEDFAPGYVDLIRQHRRDQPATALRSALHDLIHLGYNRITTQPTLKIVNRGYPLGAEIVNGVEIAVRRDGGMAMKHFEPEATLGQLSEAMSKVAAKAKLTRLRQTAKDCGGCGRCCHDPNIPLTYFDVQSVAAHRFADLYKSDAAAALSRTHSMLAFPRPVEPRTMLSSVPSLTFRKKDGSGGANSPCVFLDGRGLCGVYLGRPLLCRLYHCAEPSVAVENLYKSAFCTVEWLGRIVESGHFRPPKIITLPELLEQPLLKLASPFALMKVAEEIEKLSL